MKHGRLFVLFFIVISVVMSFFFSINGRSAVIGSEQPGEFNEIWGYLMRGEETKLAGDDCFTDIGYFSIGVNYKGKLTSPVKPPELKSLKKARIHLVVTELSSTPLSHFCLNPSYGVRDRLVDEIVRACREFHGVQIDFESVAGDDGPFFVDFLKQIRKKLPSEKILSVALPARRKKVNDAYDYAAIASVVDRSIIMAYDQHWSGSAPGPVASLSWCNDVLAYASTVIPAEKLVMGLPLYGRAWQDRNYARALNRKLVSDIIAEVGAAPEYSSAQGSTFSYEKTVKVTVYFEDQRSIDEKLQLYRKSVKGVAFWRIGMDGGGLCATELLFRTRNR
jgi:spore germination protein YaaH